MSEHNSTESVDAIRQILFGQEKRVLEDKIQLQQLKLESIQETQNNFELDISDRLVSDNAENQTKFKQIQNELLSLNASLKELESKVAEDIQKMISSITSNQKSTMQEMKLQLTQSENKLDDRIKKLELGVAETYVRRNQLSEIFISVSKHFETVKK